MCQCVHIRGSGGAHECISHPYSVDTRVEMGDDRSSIHGLKYTVRVDLLKPCKLRPEGFIHRTTLTVLGGRVHWMLHS